MPTYFQIQLLSKTSYKPIGGRPYSVWCYQLSWDTAGIPDKLKAKVGLVFSGKLDIKDPASYPEIESIQDTFLRKQPGVDRQYVYKDSSQASAQEIRFFFLAPSEEDSFTTVLLVTSKIDVGPWNSLPFRIDEESNPSPIQTIRGPAVVDSSTAQPVQPVTANNIAGASRRIPKCTYTLLKPDDPLPEDGSAIAKFGFVGRLGLQTGEVAAAAKAIIKAGNRDVPSRSLLRTLRLFEGAPISSQLPSPSVFTRVPSSTLRAFGHAILAARREVVNQMKTSNRPGQNQGSDYATALHLQNNAEVGLNVFEANTTVSPIGWLNLERIAMTPVGIQRGELIATIPLAPLEQTAVVHKEWSVTSKEFTSIVTDSLENYSEKGVTENTELAQSTSSQTSHSNQFNINATVSGGYGPVTATVSSGFSSQNQKSDSATESIKHAVATTRKASARVKQEHKITISTTTVTGTSETSTRILQNPSATNAMRIDYFSIMRKWHVGLYRYGLRLTYDIAIPEPAAAFRKLYGQLDDLKRKIGPFIFQLSPTEITPDKWSHLQSKFQIVLPSPPLAYKWSITDTYNVQGDTSGSEAHVITLDLPEGYAVANDDPDPDNLDPDQQEFAAMLYADMTLGGTQGGYIDSYIDVIQADYIMFTDEDTGQPTRVRKIKNSNLSGDPNHVMGWNSIAHLDYLKKRIGKQYVQYEITNSNTGTVRVVLLVEPTDAGISTWQQQVWNILYDAAQAQYYTEQQTYQAQIAALEDQLTNVDTLTLRREENEEIMKGLLRWLLGPAFDFMPTDVQNLFEKKDSHGKVINKSDLTYGTCADNSGGLAVTSQSWSPMLVYGEIIKFINEAIEWENILYFVYSYFWDVPPSWDFIRQIRHPDAIRQAFLRAGSARVVLPIRKGWETAWVTFVESGGFEETVGVPKDHPYLTIAQEIRDYDQTNYPGIPPANPAGGPLPDDGESVATVSTDTLAPSNGQPVNILVESSDRFIVGYTAVIDSYDSGEMMGNTFVTFQEAQTITAKPDSTHITVERVDNPHKGSPKPFPIMQAGEQGQLIAEWFEYTPTSGTDIAVTSDLTTIA